jgi:hypothetical protein
MGSAQSNVRAISSSGKLFTIGQVLSVLNPEFPDLSPSKLRFLEEQGLIEPQRTPAGYRKFSEQDVQRTRVILELQEISTCHFVLSANTWSNSIPEKAQTFLRCSLRFLSSSQKTQSS